MVAFALSVIRPTHADGVCGDGVVDPGEQCDDGNLVSGDGCSSTCRIEKCGNGIVDAKEQCDLGPLNGQGKGCNKYCQIEFCGDHVVQPALGEQCDDGNGISGDGCSSKCQAEAGWICSGSPSVCTRTGKNGHPAAPGNANTPPAADTSATSGNPESGNSSVSPAEAAVAAASNQAFAAAAFLSSPGGEDYKQYLSREQNLQLEDIIMKIKNGRRLTKEERMWAEQLFTKLEQAKTAERARYTDLLKQFIATPISSDVVTEKNLQKNRLVDVQVPVAIEELKRAVAVIRRGELKNQVTLDVGLLHRQGISIEADLPVGYESYLGAGTQPIQVFTTLKALKEATEKYATNNLPASLDVIRGEAAALTAALPVFEREYGLKTDEAKALLADITLTSDNVTKQDAYRVVSAVNRFLLTLQRDKILTPVDLSAAPASHAAAGVARIGAEVGDPTIMTSPRDIPSFVQGMTLMAPAQYKEVFQNGTIQEQRMALLQFLGSDDRLTALMKSLPADRKAEFDARYAELKAAVINAGDNTDPATPCDDSVPEALRCSAQFLGDVQDAVRSQSYFSRIVGFLQDYFGIGQ